MTMAMLQRRANVRILIGFFLHKFYIYLIF